jgi:hypothetical protein
VALTGLQTVALFAQYSHADGSPCLGTVTFTPEPSAVAADGAGITILGPIVASPDEATGQFTITLLATDAAGVTPSGWTYTVVESWRDGTTARPPFSISLPAANPTADLAALAPVGSSSGSGGSSGLALLIANNLSDLESPAVARTNLGLGSAATEPASAFDAAGAAASAQSAAETYAGQQVAAEATRANAAYDASGAASAAQTAAETYTSGQISTEVTRANSAYDAAGAAAAAQTAAETYSAGEVSAEITRANAAYDAAGAATAALGTSETYTNTKITSEVSRANTAYDAAGAAAGAVMTAEAYTGTELAAEVTRANSAYDAAGAAAAAITTAEAQAAATYLPAAALATSVPYPPTLRLPRYQQASAICTDFQAGHGWVSDISGSGTYTANDTSTFVRGSQCATLTTPGDGVTYHVYGTFTAVSLAAAIPRVTAQIVNITNLASIQVDVCTDTTWTNGWTWTMQTGASGSNFLTSGDWVTQSLSFHTATKIGSGATTGLAAARFRIADIGGGSANAATVHLQGFDTVPSGAATFPTGVISITFDDCYEDAITAGKPCMDLYGFNATSFVIADLIGTSERLSLTDLRNLQKDSGWEIACHAYADAVHSATYTGVTAAALLADATAMKAYATANGFRGADLVAYPKGQYGQTVDGFNTELILEQVYGLGLTTVNKTKETYPPSDAFRVRRISSISSYTGDGQEYLTSLITQTGGDLDQCKATSSWLILAFHEVVATPTADTQISTADFASIMAGIASRGIPVMPVGEVLRWANTAGTVAATIDTTDIPKKAGTPGATGSGPLAAPWDHVHPRTYWAPEDHGYISWSFEPIACNSSGTAPAAGTLQMTRLHIPVATTISNLHVFVQSVSGVSLTSGECFAALFTSSGTWLASTADQSTAWTTTGDKPMALTSPQAVAAGDYDVAFFANGSGIPTFAKAVSGFSIVNANLTGSTARFATAATGLTTAMPGSAGTRTGSSNAFWVAAA